MFCCCIKVENTYGQFIRLKLVLLDARENVSKAFGPSNTNVYVKNQMVTIDVLCHKHLHNKRNIN